MNAPRWAGFGVTGLAALWVVSLALAATAPALFGSRSLGPEAMLDRDPLYAVGDPPPEPTIFDRTRYYYDVPRDFAAADGIRNGRLDLWNPRAAFGMPLWGEGGAPFFPAKFPFYLAPSRRSYDLASALRLVVAGLGAFLLARQRGLAPVPAMAAGGLFELSGAITATLPYGVGAPPCMLPWLLLGAQVIAQRRSPAAAAATGLALGITASSGHPMLVVAVFVGFGAAVGGHVLAAWRQPREAFAIGALAILAAAIGFTVAAPAILPVLEAQHEGRLYKSTGFYGMQLAWYRFQTRNALPVALFAPSTLEGLRSLVMGFPYALVAPTVGLLALVLAVAGLLGRGLDAALIGVGLVGVGMTLTPPLLGSVTQLPLLQYVYPMYAWSLVSLPLSQAAGRGVASLSTGQGRWTLLAALAVVLAGASSLFYVQDLFPGTYIAFNLREALIASLAGWSGWLRLVLPLAMLPVFVVALVAASRTRFARRCAVAASLLACLELLWFVSPTSWFPDSAVLGSAPSPAVQFLQQRPDGNRYRMLGSPPTVGFPITPSLFGLADVRGSSALPSERYVRYLEAIAPNPSWSVLQWPAVDVLRHPLLDLGGVRYIVQALNPASDPESLLQGDAALRLVYRDERVAIYENDAALPRARIVHEALPVRDGKQAFRRLVGAAATGPHAVAAGLADRIFVEPSADGQVPPVSSPAAAPDAEKVEMLPGDDPDQVELEASLSAAGWLVLADSFYPGWTATIDGEPTPIHPTNLLFRGVFVPPGTHRVVFRYEPPVFRLGLALAVVGLAISGILLVRGAGRSVAVDRPRASTLSGGSWPMPEIVWIALAASTLAFQAVYVFLPTAGVVRRDAFDPLPHYGEIIGDCAHALHRLAFRGAYTWVHFPAFYQWSAAVTRVVCGFVAGNCLPVGLEVAWFLQAVLRVATLGLLLATFRRLFRSPAVVAGALALCATSPRVFFATSSWNQDDYVFFFAVLAMYVTVAAIQEGLTTLRIVTAALATALGFSIKLTMLVPTAAMLFAFSLLPARCASLSRKAVTFLVVAGTLVAVNWPLLATSDGRARLFWKPHEYYAEKDRRNAQHLADAYLTLNPGPMLRPEKIYVPVSRTDWTGRNSTATGLFLYLFELYDHFQGPARTWLNLLCVWSGAPLLALVLWRTGRALGGLRHQATWALDELYCATLVLLSLTALVYFSLALPFGWAPHPEYVLASYPAAAVLLVRQARALRRRALVALVAGVTGLHLAANLALLVHTAHYKIGISSENVGVGGQRGEREGHAASAR